MADVHTNSSPPPPKKKKKKKDTHNKVSCWCFKIFVYIKVTCTLFNLEEFFTFVVIH